MRHLLSAVLLMLLSGFAQAQSEKADGVGVPVSYQLPADGPLPKTYRVTLAIVDAKNPRWIVSQFAAGVVRTVTAENHGKFEETWNGLDDNFMPVPPGDYGVKGIYAPADKWKVDGEFHSIVPSFSGGASAWMPTTQQTSTPEPFGGDPVGSPLRDVDVAPNGIAAFYYQYLENGLNNPMVDLKKPIALEQFLRAFGSGGAAGGGSTCTDGETVWSYSEDGGAKFVYRADGKPFGTGNGRYRSHVYVPAGRVAAMACYRDEATKATTVYIAEVSKDSEKADPDGKPRFVDSIHLLAGQDGAILGQNTVHHPRGLAARGGILYVLHEDQKPGVWEVASAPLEKGLPDAFVPLFTVPENITPTDLEVDSHGRIYLSDTAANKVYQFDAHGKMLATFGRTDRQKPGAYDPLTLMSPGKLATWKDGDGNDRLLVVENDGPNRVSEWSADGKLLREFMTLQTKANDGYAVDPEHADSIYLAGHGGWLTRFKVDYEKHAWAVDAVWPDVGTDPKSPHLDHPKAVRLNGRLYLACGRSRNIYRYDGTRWLLSAAIIAESGEGKKAQRFLWHDANGDGKVQEDEYRNTPMELPGTLLKYHGEQWLDDLSVVTTNQTGPDVWRLAPSSFDDHGNPVFTSWEKLLTDPILEARANRTLDAIHGGNELDKTFHSDWAEVDGSLADGFFVSARGGQNFSANEGGQYRLSRYTPNGKGGFDLQWRAGRAAFQGLAKEGEVYGAIHVYKPINGLVSVIDQTRCGVVLFTTDGFYVDTVFPDGRRIKRETAGVYALPGEFFAGVVYANRDNGKIYFGMGKYTPMLFEAVGWSLKENPVRPIDAVTKTVSIKASQIAPAPEVALKMRGGAGLARVAEVAPASGGVALDGSMEGWEACRPAVFSSDKDQSVEARCMYDPEHLYVRWHVRLASKFDAKALAPIDRIFTHDRGADTVSLYFQGDPEAKSPGPKSARPGDVRIVFGVFKDGEKDRPAALGMYPIWTAPGASPVTYRTPVGQSTYAHVGEVAGANLAHLIDADGKGFVIAAGLPRSAFPGLPKLSGNVRTTINFEATLGGHNKFWWANSDGSANHETYDEPSEAWLYPGSWAPVVFQDLATGLTLRHWQVIGPFGFKELPELKHVADRAKICATMQKTKYPPELKIDLAATYTGEVTQTRIKQRTLKWIETNISDQSLPLRDVKNIDWKGNEDEGAFYLASWVHSPHPAQVKIITIDDHGHHSITGWINAQPLPEGKGPSAIEHRIDPTKPVSLKTGWNQVLVRFDHIWGANNIGIKFEAPAGVLWGLKTSANPPDKEP